MKPLHGWLDLSDPRVAAELENLRRNAAEMETLMALASRRAAEHAAQLEEFEHLFTPEPTPQPVVTISIFVDVVPGLDLDAPDEPVRH